MATQPQKFPTANNKEDTSARVDLGLELNWIGFRFRLIFFLDFGLGFWGGMGSGFCLGPRLRSFENTRTRVLRAKCELESEQRPFSAAPTSRNRSNLFEYFN